MRDQTMYGDAASGQAVRSPLRRKRVATDNDRQLVLECMDNLEFMAPLPDGHFKLIVTSPPYNLGKNPTDVWAFPNVKSNHPEKTIHPCQFPVELVERLVLSMTDPDDAVFDPYVGVGSSLIAALKHNRAAFGCDVVREYVDIAHARIRQMREGKLKTRPMGKPIHDPSKPRQNPLTAHA